MANVNKWESNAKKPKWLKVRRIVRALKAFRQLPEAPRRDYKEAKKALKKRFELRAAGSTTLPSCKLEDDGKAKTELRTGRSLSR